MHGDLLLHPHYPTALRRRQRDLHRGHRHAAGVLLMAPAIRRRRSAGQSMVEFALIAPLMFVLLLGLVDLARAVYYYNVISNSAREGAREAILLYNQCQNTAPCSSPPAGATIVGVRPAMARAGGGIVAFPAISDAGSATGTAPACTPSANSSCVWVFTV